MRARTAIPMVLLALASCKSRALPASPDAAPSASVVASASASPSAVASASAQPKPTIGAAEQVPGQDGRFFIDNERFSALYPVFPLFPLAKFRPPLAIVEAEAPNGSSYAVICAPSLKKGPDAFDQAKQKAVGDGKFIAESHPAFPGGDGYEVHAKLKDGGERIMRFVSYAARLCTVSAELAPGEAEQKGIDFVQSFRREPPPT
jgi:hypothetical protein